MNAPLADISALQWTPERVALLRRHHAVGLTASESAILLGGVTKNAVISKRNRLGLRGVMIAVRPLEPGAPAARFRTRRFKLEPIFRCEPLPSMDPTAPVGAAPKPLAQHQRGECLWPLGLAEAAVDWRTLFCCAPAARPRRYCPAHLARARGAAPSLGSPRHEG